MRNLSTIISKETCLFYGLPGTVILAVSLVISCKVGNDLGGNTLVNTVPFFGCNVLLWLLYLVLFQYLPVDLMKIWISKKESTTNEITKAAMEQAKPSTDAVVKLKEPPIITVKPMLTEEYQKHCAEFKRRKQEERQTLIDAIIDYVGRVMAPFMEKKELDMLRNEILAWCDDPNHKPQPVKLKTIHDYKDKLKTISFKHFTWNIAARLGFENGYSGENTGRFHQVIVPQRTEGRRIQIIGKKYDQFT